MRLENKSEVVALALKDTSTDEVTEIIEKLTMVRDQMQKLEKEKFNNTTEHKTAIRELSNGSVKINFVDKPHKKFKRPPKYQYKDENGVTKTWWGGGVMPVALRQAITNEEGIEDRSKLEAFLIPKTAGHYQYKDKEGNVCFWNGQGDTPKDLQILLNNGVPLESFDTRVSPNAKPVIAHTKGGIYEFSDKQGKRISWNPDMEEMPYELLRKITVMGQPRPELLRKYLKV